MNWKQRLILLISITVISSAYCFIGGLVYEGGLMFEQSTRGAVILFSSVLIIILNIIFQIWND